jgi:hypothetical protein
MRVDCSPKIAKQYANNDGFNNVVLEKHGCQAYTVDAYALLTKCPNHAFYPING